MPIYEYECNACRRRFSFLYGVTAESRTPACPRCRGTNLSRLFSRFATGRSEEAMLERLADPSKIGDLDDPRAVAQWAKQIGGALGPEMGMDADSVVDEMMSAAEGESEHDAADGGDEGASAVPPSEA